MSEQADPRGHEDRSAVRRAERTQALPRALLVGVAQTAAAAVTVFGCVTASSVAARSSGPHGDIADGVAYLLAALLLAPLAAMAVGSLAAKRLRLAHAGVYSLSVIAAVAAAALGLRGSGLLGSVLPLLLVLTAVNLLIGYSTGMRPERAERH